MDQWYRKINIKWNNWFQKFLLLHRVADIRSLVGHGNWYFIDSGSNPADILSRGLLLSNLNCNDLWTQASFILRYSTYEIQWCLLSIIHLFTVQFHGFLFGKRAFYGKNIDTVCKLLLSSHFAIEKGAIFENKFFVMFFIMVWKQMTIKILVYKVKARSCYSCFYAKISKSHSENERPFYPVAGLQQLMVRQVRKTHNPNGWILFPKTWMATENCYYNKLLKAKLLTSKLVPLLLFL